MTNYPWYDSGWLHAYAQAQDIVKQQYPSRLSEFVEAFEPLRTRSDFQVTKQQILAPEILHESRELIENLDINQLGKQELFSFGRLVVSDHPYFNQLQDSLTTRVGNTVGEEVEPSYNFLSLYNDLGICRVHMDALWAKWTLDVCIDQTAPWPIYISQVRPWPEQIDYQHHDPDWEDKIKRAPQNVFTTYNLKAGESIIFSGSSQWHYRERIVRATKSNYCNLIFFHYIPKGTQPLVWPNQWADFFFHTRAETS